MHKNILIVVGITILFLGTCITPSVAIDNVKKSSISISDGNILYVGGTGPGNYSYIQSAINDALDGYTVFVYDDSSPYYEHVLVDKSINLIGEDKITTIIDGGGIGSVIHIIVDRVTISGFTIKKSGSNTGEYDAGILLKDSKASQLNNNKLSNNIITNNYAGVIMFGNSNTVYNNTIKCNKQAGIYFGNSNNKVDNNTIKFNKFGILMSGENNNICNNDIKFGGFGIVLTDSSYNNVYQNNVTKNYNCGILIAENMLYSVENEIYLNNIMKNSNGIYISGLIGRGGPLRNNIYQNNIMYNWLGAVIDRFSYDNTIYHNNFIKNFWNTRDWNGSRNFWDDGSEGNYWDNYRGKDRDGNGIGDRPFRIFPYFTGNKDSYPLMEPYEDVPDVTIKAVNNILRTRASSYLWYHWFLNRFPLLERLLNLLR